MGYHLVKKSKFDKKQHTQAIKQWLLWCKFLWNLVITDNFGSPTRLSNIPVVDLDCLTCLPITKYGKEYLRSCKGIKIVKSYYYIQVLAVILIGVRRFWADIQWPLTGHYFKHWLSVFIIYVCIYLYLWIKDLI